MASISPRQSIPSDPEMVRWVKNAHPGHGPSYADEYARALEELDQLRLIKEDTEIEISSIENQIKQIKYVLIKKFVFRQ